MEESVSATVGRIFEESVLRNRLAEVRSAVAHVINSFVPVVEFGGGRFVISETNDNKDLLEPVYRAISDMHKIQKFPLCQVSGCGNHYHSKWDGVVFCEEHAEIANAHRIRHRSDSKFERMTVLLNVRDTTGGYHHAYAMEYQMLDIMAYLCPLEYAQMEERREVSLHNLEEIYGDYCCRECGSTHFLTSTWYTGYVCTPKEMELLRQAIREQRAKKCKIDPPTENSYVDDDTEDYTHEYELYKRSRGKGTKVPKRTLSSAWRTCEGKW